jgi:hypothetical protein
VTVVYNPQHRNRYMAITVGHQLIAEAGGGGNLIPKVMPFDFEMRKDGPVTYKKARGVRPSEILFSHTSLSDRPPVPTRQEPFPALQDKRFTPLIFILIS